MKPILKKALPHIIAIVSFFIITIGFYHPIVLQNKIIRQNDMNQGKAAGLEMKEFRETTGEEGLWTNSMFSGMPAYLINMHWSGSSILDVMQSTVTFGFDQPVRETFLCFLAFYILLIVFGVNPYLAIAGAIAYGFSTFFIISIEAGHIWKLRAIAYAPLVMAGIHLAYTRHLLWGFTLTALSTALEIYANHLQITYYLFILIFIYIIFLVYKKLREGGFNSILKPSIVLIIAGIIGVSANLGRIWTTYEYGKYSIRGNSELSTTPSSSSQGLDRDYAFSWSSGKLESLTFLIPHFYGGASGVYSGKDSEVKKVLLQNKVPESQANQYERAFLGYWGSQPSTAGPIYIGAIICFLFVFGFFYKNSAIKWWLISATVLAILLSWGKNFETFNYFMFEYFPGYNKFRSVSMAVFIAALTMPLLGFLKLDEVIKEGFSKEVLKQLLIATGITGGFSLIVLILANPPAPEGNQLPQWLLSAVDNDRTSIIRKDAFRSLFYIAAAFGIIYATLKNKIGKELMFAGLALLVLLDLVLVNTRYLTQDNYIRSTKNEFFQKTEADIEILKDESLSYRVLNFNNPFNEARTSVFHKSIGGYHGAKIRRYSDLIERHLVPEMQQISKDQRLTSANTNVLNMLNTRYLLLGNSAESIVKNDLAYGNAWFVSKLDKVKSPDEEISTIGNVELRSVAVIDESKFQTQFVEADTVGSIQLTEYRPNYLKYESINSVDGLAVFSEIFYPEGWKATIDGNAVDILRANYVLRALEVPSGSHTIEFTFEPKSYFIGNKVMMGGSVLLALSLIISLVMSARSLKL